MGPPLPLLESLEFLHQGILVLLLLKLDNGLRMNLTPPFPMESLTVFIMEKIVLFLTLEIFRDGLSQQPASRFLFPMMTLLRLFLSASMKGMDVQAKNRLLPLSNMNNCAGDFVDQLGLGHLLDFFN